jgi:phage tail sheath protein FI
MPSGSQEAVRCVDYRQNGLNLNSSWSAMYTSDLLIRDGDNGRNIYVPPSGHVAAMYAKLDRKGTWLAPGGLKNGKLTGVLGVREEYKQGHLNMLAENQINPILVKSGNGVNIWGADTMYAVKSALNDIGVRRLLAMLHGSVRVNNLYAVFQPNDTYLRTQQRTSLENILEPVLKAGGLYWYDVISDSRNNSPQQEANGDLIIDVYLDPTRYTKRIHLNAIVPKTGEIQTTIEQLDRI